MSGLSERGKSYLTDDGGLERIRKLLGDLYDPVTNVDGIVNLGTAENNVMLSELARFANEKLTVGPRNVSYGEGPWGDQALCKSMAKYLNRYFKPFLPVQPQELLFVDGVTAMMEMLGYTLFNEGDGVLLSRPIYQAFKPDLGLKAKVEIVFTSFDGVDQFSPEATAKYEEALQKAEAQGTKVRALLLCHPHNPLGKCYPRETLIALMRFCNKHSIHLLCDEIYALSVYDVPDPHAVKFESAMSFDSKEYIKPEYLHLIYGFSKDLAASGLRLGVFHTHNKDIMAAMSAIVAPHWSGSLNQRMAYLMLEDEQWTDTFLKTSQKLLADRNVFTRQLLEKNGLDYVKGSNAGFFLWIDLRPFLTKKSFQPGGANPKGNLDTEIAAELENASLDDGWTAENDLTKRMFENKVFLTPGQSMFAEEPGWYRLIFSQEKPVLEEGIKRLMKTLSPA